MAATLERGRAASAEIAPILNPEQMTPISASGSGGPRKPKAKEPEVYRGERHKLRGWLAQLIVYYRTVGWQNERDEGKILCATSLLGDDSGTWMTPYAEEGITPTWDKWAVLKAELGRQFGVIDAKGEARIRLKKHETRQRIGHGILERIPPCGWRSRIGQLNWRRTTSRRNDHRIAERLGS